MKPAHTFFFSVWLGCGAVLTTSVRCPAQTFTMLKDFGASYPRPWRPHSELAQGPDSTLYGTTGMGDISGMVFKAQPDGSGFTVLKYFTNSAEGYGPWAG